MGRVRRGQGVAAERRVARGRAAASQWAHQRRATTAAAMAAAATATAEWHCNARTCGLAELQGLGVEVSVVGEKGVQWQEEPWQRAIAELLHHRHHLDGLWPQALRHLAKLRPHVSESVQFGAHVCAFRARRGRQGGREQGAQEARAANKSQGGESICSGFE